MIDARLCDVMKKYLFSNLQNIDKIGNITCPVLVMHVSLGYL